MFRGSKQSPNWSPAVQRLIHLPDKPLQTPHYTSHSWALRPAMAPQVCQGKPRLLRPPLALPAPTAALANSLPTPLLPHALSIRNTLFPSFSSWFQFVLNQVCLPPGRLPASPAPWGFLVPPSSALASFAASLRCPGAAKSWRGTSGYQEVP